jgi:hypothetical protein
MIWALFIAGLLLSVLSAGYLYFAWDSAQWPTTSGKVLHSKVIEINVHSSIVHRPMLVYEYVINGVSRQSATIGFFVGTEGKEWSEHLLIERPVGADVLVYYHPRFPRFAVLESGIKQPWAWLTMMGVGGVIALSSGVVLFAEDRYLLLNTLFGFIRNLVIQFEQ